MTPSSAPPARPSQRRASSRSRVTGRELKRSAAASRPSCRRPRARRGARSAAASSRRAPSASDQQSNSDEDGRRLARTACGCGSRRDAGASAERRRRGCRRSAMTSSPSSTKRVAGQRAQHVDDLREVASERLAGLGAQLDLVAGPEGEAAEAVPLRLELPAGLVGERVGGLRLHRRRVDRQVERFAAARRCRRLRPRHRCWAASCCTPPRRRRWSCRCPRRREYKYDPASRE